MVEIDILLITYPNVHYISVVNNNNNTVSWPATVRLSQTATKITKTSGYKNLNILITDSVSKD